MNVTTVDAVPLDRSFSIEYLAVGYVINEFSVPCFVELFHFRYLVE